MTVRFQVFLLMKINNMTKDKNINTAVPELRFPEFKGDGEWEGKTLGKVCEKPMYGLNASAKIYDGENGYLRITDIDEDSREINNSKLTSPSYLSEAYRVKLGDLFFARTGASTGKSYLYKESDGKLYFAGFLIKFTIRSASPKFVYYNTLTDKYYRWVKAVSIRSGQPGINADQYSMLTIMLPTIDEQQKIAECLSSLDDLINSVADKIEALKDHKKGLMQKLFPAKGQTVPEFRFPEFEGDGEWEEKNISKVCNPYSGGTPKSSENKFYGGNIPFIRSGEISRHMTELYLTDDGLNSSSAKMINKGDVLVALYGANSGDVAIAKIDGAINQAILCLQSTENNYFIYLYLLLKKQFIISTYLQGGQGNLSGDIIRSIKLFFPSPKEQQKIADCLSSLDNDIEIQSNKLEELKAHKKGLMQKLFPKI